MAEIFVILYDTPVYGRPQKLQTLFHRAVDEGTTGLSSPSNPHFVGKFKPTVYRQPILSTPEDRSQYPGADPHFIGKFQPTVYGRPIISIPEDLSNPVNSESGANAHFIGAFTPTKYQQPINSWDIVGVAAVIPPDDPPNFIAKFLPTSYNNDIRLRQTQNTDFILTPNHIETPINFIGPFFGTVYKNDPNIRQFNPSDGLAPPPPSDVQHIWATAIVRKPL